MSEASLLNLVSFAPYGGGQGARLTATNSSGRVAIPGLEGGQQGDNSRVMVCNEGAVSVKIRLGGSSVAAGTASYAILPGTKEVLRPPNIGTQPVYLAAITESGEAIVTVCAGEGT